jgi:hypothetical protein
MVLLLVAFICINIIYLIVSISPVKVLHLLVTKKSELGFHSPLTITDMEKWSVQEALVLTLQLQHRILVVV